MIMIDDNNRLTGHDDAIVEANPTFSRNYTRVE